MILLSGADVKLAGSLSLAASLPTMIMGFTRYSQDASFAVLARNRSFLQVMAAGSIVGSSIDAQLVGIVPADVLLPLLAAILLAGAFRVWGVWKIRTHHQEGVMVPGAGIEPATRGFSIRCSTN